VKCEKTLLQIPRTTSVHSAMSRFIQKHLISLGVLLLSLAPLGWGTGTNESVYANTRSTAESSYMPSAEAPSTAQPSPATFSPAGQPPLASTVAIAALDLVPKAGISIAEAKALTDILLTQIHRYMPSGYLLIDKANRDSLLREQQFALSNASDTLSGTIRVGKLLSAQLVVSGSISKMEANTI